MSHTKELHGLTNNNYKITISYSKNRPPVNNDAFIVYANGRVIQSDGVDINKEFKINIDKDTKFIGAVADGVGKNTDFSYQLVNKISENVDCLLKCESKMDFEQLLSSINKKMIIQGIKGNSTIAMIVINHGKIYYISIGDSFIYSLTKGLNFDNTFCKRSITANEAQRLFDDRKIVWSDAYDNLEESLGSEQFHCHIEFSNINNYDDFAIFTDGFRLSSQHGDSFNDALKQLKDDNSTLIKLETIEIQR